MGNKLIERMKNMGEAIFEQHFTPVMHIIQRNKSMNNYFKKWVNQHVFLCILKIYEYVIDRHRNIEKAMEFKMNNSIDSINNCL